MTGASTAPELGGALAKAEDIAIRISVRRTLSTGPAAPAMANTPRTCCPEALSWDQRWLDTGTMRA
jgi:hypothetical protein